MSVSHFTRPGVADDYSEENRRASTHLDWLLTQRTRGNYLASHMYYNNGGRNGCVVFDDTDTLKVVATSPTSMQVDVSAGAGQFRTVGGDVGLYVQDSATTLDAFTAPVSNDRIDVIQFNFDTWEIEVLEGTEDASPSAPSVSSTAIKLAEIYLRPGATSIEDADDASNGYITDGRTLTNA